MTNALQNVANVATVISLFVSVVALLRANKAVKLSTSFRNSGTYFSGQGGAGGGGGGGSGGGAGGAGGGVYFGTQPNAD